MQPQFDPLAGIPGATMDSVRSIWTHQADARDGTPWRVWQRPVGDEEAGLELMTLTYPPRGWRCHHNRGFTTPGHAVSMLALQCASQMAYEPKAQAALSDDGYAVHVGGLRLIVATLAGDVATHHDSGLDSASQLAEAVSRATAIRNEHMR